MNAYQIMTLRKAEFPLGLAMGFTFEESGPVALALRTHFSIDLLRLPGSGAVIARTEMLKLGKRLAVVRVDMTTEADASALVATATVTHSIPPA